MRNIRTFLPLWISLLLVNCNIRISAGIKWTKYEYETEPKCAKHGYMCASNETVFRHENVDTVSCGKLGHMKEEAIFIVYQPENRTCIGCLSRRHGTYEDPPGSMSYSRLPSDTIGQKHKRVCFFTERVCGHALDTKYCTHLVYGLKKLAYHNGTFTINAILDKEAEDRVLLAQMREVKSINPSVKLLVSVITETRLLAEFAQECEDRKNLIESTLSYLKENGLDGLMMKWESSFGPSNRLPNSDQHMLQLIKEMRQEFHAEGLVLSLEVTWSNAIHADLDYHDLGKVVRYLDFLLVFTGVPNDMPNETSGINTLIRNKPVDGQSDIKDIKAISEYLISKGVPKAKVIMALRLTGNKFILEKEEDGSKLGAKTNINWPLQLTYREICHIQENDDVTEYWDADHIVPFFTIGSGFQVTYENVRSVSEKVKWLKEEGYGGAGIWGLCDDDYENACKSSGGPYPIARAVYDILA